MSVIKQNIYIYIYIYIYYINYLYNRYLKFSHIFLNIGIISVYKYLHEDLSDTEEFPASNAKSK